MLTPRFAPPKAWIDDYNHFTLGFFDMLRKLTTMGVRGRALEIGCYTGEGTAMLGMSGLFDEIHCIEPFSGDCEMRDPLDEWWKIKSEFMLNTRHFPITLHQGYSYDILPNLDVKFDFIYIDAAHDFESVKKDIELSLPLLKSGGVIAGHDYMPEHRGVIKAVHLTLGLPTHRFADDSWMYASPR